MLNQYPSLASSFMGYSVHLPPQNDDCSFPSSEANRSAAQLEYSYRLPTEPRIIVPPPTVSSDLPVLRFESTYNQLDTMITNRYDLTNVLKQNTLLEWAYDQRRAAQMVLPMLYLGPISSAKDARFVEKEGITMALVVRSHSFSMRGVIQTAQQMGLEVTTVEAATNFDLPKVFPKAIRMINDHLRRMFTAGLGTAKGPLGKVLVFCESGNEKSAAVVAAFLMVTLSDCDHIRAIQICQQQRFCVNFDDTIKQALRNFWDIVQATRNVSSSSSVQEIREPDPYVQQHVRNESSSSDEDMRDPDTSPPDPGYSLKRSFKDMEPEYERDYRRGRKPSPFMDRY